MGDLNDADIHPRTAIGYSRNGKFLYIVVVDGRQPFYSEGVTLAELAQLMLNLGAHDAMNLDGGGSSALVVRGADGSPRVLNSPIDLYIPGRERPVANHLGIYFKKEREINLALLAPNQIQRISHLRDSIQLVQFFHHNRKIDRTRINVCLDICQRGFRQTAVTHE